MYLEKERQDIIDIGRKLYEKGFVAANDGNISLKISDNEILITTTGISKGEMRLEHIVLVDRNGILLCGDNTPTSEMKMHLTVYRERPEIKAVVHAHPPDSTAFAVAQQPMDMTSLSEVILSVGKIALAAYATPSTDEVSQAIEPYLCDSDAVLMANHGVLTIGRSLKEAYYKMETIEHFARILISARLLGGAIPIPENEVAKLNQIRYSNMID